MKEVVRKKLGVSDSVPIFLSQIREGRSVDLEDGTAYSFIAQHNENYFCVDDDFEAFRAAARGSPVVCVKVFLGDHSTASEPAKNENSTVCIVDAFLCSTLIYFIANIFIQEEEEEKVRYDSD